MGFGRLAWVVVVEGRVGKTGSVTTGSELELVDCVVVVEPPLVELRTKLVDLSETGTSLLLLLWNRPARVAAAPAAVLVEVDGSVVTGSKTTL